MSDRINIEALRKEYGWRSSCVLDGATVLALVDAVVAAERVLPFLKPRHRGYLTPVLDRFDFDGGESDASE